MKIYIAAPWKDRDLARVIGERCESRGLRITHKWWDHEGEFDDAPLMRKCAQADLNGIKCADLVILLNTQTSEGKVVEQGIALASGIPIVAVGEIGKPNKNIFHYLPDYTWVAGTDGPDGLFQFLEDYGPIN